MICFNCNCIENLNFFFSLTLTMTSEEVPTSTENILDWALLDAASSKVEVHRSVSITASTQSVNHHEEHLPIKVKNTRMSCWLVAMTSCFHQALKRNGQRRSVASKSQNSWKKILEKILDIATTIKRLGRPAVGDDLLLNIEGHVVAKQFCDYLKDSKTKTHGKSLNITKFNDLEDQNLYGKLIMVIELIYCYKLKKH